MTFHTRMMFAGVAFFLVHSVAAMRIKEKLTQTEDIPVYLPPVYLPPAGPQMQVFHQPAYQPVHVAYVVPAPQFRVQMQLPLPQAPIAAQAVMTGCVIPGNGRTLTIGEELGKGAEGTVYEGIENGEPAAAVKIMFSGSVNATELRNLKALTSVHSQHLLRLEGGFEAVQTCCNKPCLITQLIRGKDMAKIMWDNGFYTLSNLMQGVVQRGAMSYQLLRSIILQSLAAFRDTENAGLCNHDQHTRNIMYEDGSERVVFIDFGMAQTIHPCPPKLPFEADTRYDVAVQSFRSFEHLIEEADVKREFVALCDRMVKPVERGGYRSAAEALVKEAFADSSQDPSKPGRFFALRNLDVIKKQLEALKTTGSPHIGCTAPSPFSGKECDAPPPSSGKVEQVVPVQPAIDSGKKVIVKQPTAALPQQVPFRPVIRASTTYEPHEECWSTCGARQFKFEDPNGHLASSVFNLDSMGFLPQNHCAACGLNTDENTRYMCNPGGTLITTLYLNNKFEGSICCHRKECTPS